MNSGGGPLVCATPLAGANWRGVNGSSIADVRTDYARACAELDYLGVIPCSSFEVLVLGDEPLQSAFARIGEDVVIARWVSCVSGERAVAAISSMPSQLPAVAEVCQFSVDENCLCLFDAALDKPLMLDTGSSVIDVGPGRYEVTTENYKRDQEFEFLIHRLRRRLPAA